MKKFCKEPVGENSFFKKRQDLVHAIKTFRIYSKIYCVHTAAMEFSQKIFMVEFAFLKLQGSIHLQVH